MSSWRRHLHRCPCCLKLRSCHNNDCERTDEVVGAHVPDKPVGPSVHGGNGGMYVGNPIFCARCAPEIDPEAMDLLVTLNRVPDLRTLESCCGHGEDVFKVWLEATADAQLVVRRALAAVQPHGRQWELDLEPIRGPRLFLEVPRLRSYLLRSQDKGASAYGQATLLARNLHQALVLACDEPDYEELAALETENPP
jgi:hypothetical protein